jgi:hypothetical protein
MESVAESKEKRAMKDIHFKMEYGVNYVNTNEAS